MASRDGLLDPRSSSGHLRLIWPLLVLVVVAEGCVCPAGGADCGGSCVDLQTAITDCGACGRTCALGEICRDAQCVCPTDTRECGGLCRSVATDAFHCGACDHACPEGASCAAGACVCPGAFTLCGDRCVDLTLVTSCGACATVCAEGASCVEGSCTCPGTAADACDAVCRDLANDDEHCGACDVRCEGGASCREFDCTCPAGTDECPSGCVDLLSDARNCSACGAACPPTAVCAAGACVCPGGRTECDGACVDTTADDANCGTCGRSCPSDASCSASECHPRHVFALGLPSSSSVSRPWDAALAIDDDANVVLAYSAAGGATTVSSYDATGGARWARSLGGASTRVGGVCAEPSTNRSAVVYGTGSGTAISIVVLDTEGVTVWSRALTGSSRTLAGGCAFGTDGTLSVGGSFGGSVDFGGTTRADIGFGDGFLATYGAADGVLVSVQRYGTGTTDDPLQVAIAADGDRLITGQTGGVAMTIGTATVRGPYVARVHADGTPMWATSLPFDVGGGVLPFGRAAVSPSGDIYVPGILENTSAMSRTEIIAGVSHTIARNTAEATVVALTDLGVGRWIAAMPFAYAGSPPDVSVGDDGVIYVAGSYDEAFVAHVLPLTRQWAGYLVAWHPSGAAAWARTFDGGEPDYALDVATRGDLLAVVGRADAEVDLGGGPVAMGLDDVWLSAWVP